MKKTLLFIFIGVIHFGFTQGIYSYQPDSLKKIDKEAKYNGDWSQLLRKNLTYPNEAINKNIQGEVVVKFMVDTLGVISSLKAVSGPSLLRKEAERVILLSGKWIPAEMDGKKVKAFRSQKIVFKLTGGRDTSFFSQQIHHDFFTYFKEVSIIAIKEKDKYIIYKKDEFSNINEYILNINTKEENLKERFNEYDKRKNKDVENYIQKNGDSIRIIGVGYINTHLLEVRIDTKKEEFNIFVYDPELDDIVEQYISVEDFLGSPFSKLLLTPKD